MTVPMLKQVSLDGCTYLACVVPLYLVLFGAMIIFFCYFYTALVFSPREVAENLKRSGAYIPGIRPGQQTQRYLSIRHYSSDLLLLILEFL